METNPSNGIRFYRKQNLLNSIVHSFTGMSHFTVVYRKVLCHTLDLVQLPAREKVSTAANTMTKQA